MTGQLLNFNVRESQGVITAEDGNRYTFLGSEWKEEATPQKGMKLDFIVSDGLATDVYVVSSSLTVSSNDDWYKSSDNKMISGVCSGIAHKFQLSITGVRISTVILSIFFIFPLIIYIVLSLLLASRTTRIG